MVGQMLMELLGIMVSQFMKSLVEFKLLEWLQSGTSSWARGVATRITGYSWSVVILTVVCLLKMVEDPAAYTAGWR
jgi:hypothetical protein